MRRQRLLTVLLCIGVVAGQQAAVTAAEQAPIEFDVATTAACQELKPNEGHSAHTDEDLLDVRIHVSSLFRNADSNNYRFVYRLICEQPNVTVHDYAPRTTLEAAMAGPVTIEQKDESTKSIGLSVAGELSYAARGTSNANAGKKNSSAIKYSLLPPLELLAASGTVQRSRGAYFKLKANNRTTLEGGREFGLVLCVPSTWRCGLLTLTCEAQPMSTKQSTPSAETATSVRRNFNVILFRDGDAAAKRAAQEFAATERAFLDASRAEIQDQSNKYDPSVWQRVTQPLSDVFGSSLALANQDKQDRFQWLEEFMQQLANQQLPADWLTKLPKSVRSQAEAYVNSRRNIQTNLASDVSGEIAQESKSDFSDSKT